MALGKSKVLQDYDQHIKWAVDLLEEYIDNKLSSKDENCEYYYNIIFIKLTLDPEVSQFLNTWYRLIERKLTFRYQAVGWYAVKLVFYSQWWVELYLYAK